MKLIKIHISHKYQLIEKDIKVMQLNMISS